MGTMRQLLRPQIEGADAHRPALHALEKLPVNAHLLLLRGQRTAGQEQKLRPIEAHAAGAVLHDLPQFAQQVDVGLEAWQNFELRLRKRSHAERRRPVRQARV